MKRAGLVFMVSVKKNLKNIQENLILRWGLRPGPRE